MANRFYIVTLVVCFLLSAVFPVVAEETVKLTIDFNQAKVANKEFATLAWEDSMTVHDAMIAAGRLEKGPKFTIRGRGETAFLQAIDGVKNQGGGDKNWIFKVNGKLADRSFAVKKLSAGDQVLWRFQKFE